MNAARSGRRTRLMHVSRSSAGSHPLRVRFGEFELDEANALLLRGGSAIPLFAPTPFGLLCALVRQPGSLLTKHALLDQVWGHSYVSDSVLKTAISDLRTVLVDDPRQPRYIETVARRGYRSIAATTGCRLPPHRLPATRSLTNAQRPAPRRRHHSSAARANLRASVEHGTAPVAGSARSYGSPASRESAARSSSTSFRASVTSHARVGSA